MGTKEKENQKKRRREPSEIQSNVEREVRSKKIETISFVFHIPWHSLCGGVLWSEAREGRVVKIFLFAFAGLFFLS